MKFLVKENASYLVEQFRKVKVLSVLSDTELRTIVSQMRGFEFKAGTRIVNQGELANLFFIVQTGSVEVSVKIFFLGKRQTIEIVFARFISINILSHFDNIWMQIGCVVVS